MAWIYLFIAGLFEVAWAIGLKYTDGWSKFYPSAITIFLMIVSFVFLSLAVKTLPVGNAYAVWTGIGAIGTTLLGMILFDESREPARLACLALVIAGIVGLKLTSPD